MKTFSAVVSFLCYLHLFVTTCSGCPDMCLCKWKGGKITVECVDKTLDTIPKGIDPQVQVLDLSTNLFRTLKNHTFQQKGLVNLQKIYLTHCHIETINNAAFHQLKNLVDLDLSENKLTSFPKEPLRETPHLRKLILNHNRITALDANAFEHLLKLTTLDLGHNLLGLLDKQAFNHLTHLELLKLEHNRLTALDVQTFQSLTKLSGLLLNANPWVCDCAMRPIREWMFENNIPLGVPPTCFLPERLKDQSWDALDLDEFACLPRVETNGLQIVAFEGQNVTLFCRVNADPKADLWWNNNDVSNSSLITSQKYLMGESNQGSSLTILSVDAKDNSLFSCLASNKAGTTNLTIAVSVVSRPRDYTHLTKGQIVGIVAIVIFLFFCGLGLAVLFLAKRRIEPSRPEQKRPPMGFFKFLTRKKQEGVEIQVKETYGGHEVDKLKDHSHSGESQAPDLIHDKININAFPNGYPREKDNDGNGGKKIFDEQWSLQRAQPITYEDHMKKTSPRFPDLTYTQQQQHYASYATPIGLAENPDPYTEQGSYAQNYLYQRTNTMPWRKSPVALPNSSTSHVTTNYSPDEGFGEEPLEGTEV